MEPRHLINIADIDLPYWESLYALCRDIIAHPNDFNDACRGSVMASLFFEPSTRTKFSFQAAMLRLGGSVFGFENAQDTSAAKGEILADTIRMTSSYSDVIVMRSPYEGASKAASLFSEVPVINAGDGGHMHPTQTLADLTTIAETRGNIGGCTVGLCGDLKYGRTVHSLVTALSMFPDVNFVLLSPQILAMPDYILRFLSDNNITFRECDTLSEAIPELDVLYMTRIQRERDSDISSLVYDDSFVLTREKLQSAKRDLTILHPLPRVNEIAYDVDSDPRARYFEQARYGMYIRMALLLRLTKLGHKLPAPQPVGGSRCVNPACITRSESYLPGILRPDARCDYCDNAI